jgi:hypothetical protein
VADQEGEKAGPVEPQMTRGVGIEGQRKIKEPCLFFWYIMIIFLKTTKDNLVVQKPHYLQ